LASALWLTCLTPAGAGTVSAGDELRPEQVDDQVVAEIVRVHVEAYRSQITPTALPDDIRNVSIRAVSMEGKPRRLSPELQEKVEQAVLAELRRIATDQLVETVAREYAEKWLPLALEKHHSPEQVEVNLAGLRVPFKLGDRQVELTAEVKERAGKMATEILRARIRGQTPEEALKAARDSSLGDDLVAMHQKGLSLKAQGKFVEAIEFYTRLIQQARKVLGDGHPNTAAFINELGVLNREVGEHERAIPLFAESLRIARAFFGENHAHVATYMNNLASVYVDLERFAEAEPLLKEAVKMDLATRGEGHPKFVSSLNNLGALYRKMGRFDLAERTLRLAIKTARKMKAEDRNECLGSPLNNLGELYTMIGRYVEAEALLKESLEIERRQGGEETLSLATSLSNLGQLYNDAGRLAEAEPLLVKAMETRQRLVGEKHPAFVDDLADLGAFYGNMARYAEAEALLRRAIDIDRAEGRAHGRKHALRLRNLATLYRLMRKFEQAEPIYLLARQEYEGAKLPDQTEYAGFLLEMARFHMDRNDYPRAEELFRRGTKILQERLGEAHRDTIEAGYELGVFYYTMGRYADAERLCLQSLDAARKAFGEEDPLYATALNNLAQTYEARGDYESAARFFAQALAAARKVADADPLGLAAVLNNQASLLEALGDYPSAERLYQESLELTRKHSGENSLPFAIGTQNLAGLYREMGEWQKASDLYQQALATLRKTVGQEHLETGKVLTNLGALHHGAGHQATAESLLAEALQVLEKVLPEGHPARAAALSNLASVYRSQGKEDQVEQVYRAASEALRKALGDDHPLYAAVLQNLAKACQRRGQFEQAETYLRSAVDILRKRLGEDHPDYAQALGNLADLYLETRNMAAALATMEKAADAFHTHVVWTLAGLSESRQLAFFEGAWPALESFLRVVREENQAAAPFGAQLVSQWKGLTAEVQIRRRYLTETASNPETRRLQGDLFAARAELAQIVLGPPAGMSREAVLGHRSELEKKVEALESALAEKSGRFAELRRVGRATLAEIGQALPPDGVLLDFVHFRENGAKDKAIAPLRWRYLVFVTEAGQASQPVLIDLGPAKPIDDAVAAFRQAVAKAEKGAAADEKEVRDRLAVLSRLVLAPILPHVEDKRRYIISPDGQLALVPFECLLIQGDQYLIEARQISYLTAGRDAVAYAGQSPGTTSAKEPVLVGDPDFDLSPDAKKTELAKVDMPEAAVALRGVGGSRELRPVVFRPLPATGPEVEFAARAIGGHKFLKQQALEEVVKRASSPKVLYLATHGFFLPDQELPTEGPLMTLTLASRGLSSRSWSDDFALEVPGPRIENPLLRCGLALAGANRREAVSADAGVDDGLLTGMEVAGLDLWGTQLVVLSACQTGLGDVRQGEGVMGLRRAFLLAGARRVMATLWMVPDKPTQELMGEFIKRWQAGTPAATALREAQLAMIARLRKDQGHAHPFYWAAFTLTGDWR